MLVYGGYTLVERAPWVSPAERAALEAARLAEEEEAAQTKGKKGGKKGGIKAAKDADDDGNAENKDGGASVDADADPDCATPKEYHQKKQKNVGERT